MKTDRPTILLAGILLVLLFLGYTFWPMGALLRKVIAQEAQEAADKAWREAEEARHRASREKEYESDRIRRMSEDILGGTFKAGSIEVTGTN